MELLVHMFLGSIFILVDMIVLVVTALFTRGTVRIFKEKYKDILPWSKRESKGDFPYAKDPELNILETYTLVLFAPLCAICMWLLVFVMFGLTIDYFIPKNG